jgi:cytochrome oxidase Cu insertion factor (SCO1/SenC/PrrC family)
MPLSSLFCLLSLAASPAGGETPAPPARAPAEPAVELKVGSKAPDFSLPDQSGQLQRLSSFRGKKSVVLAFYVMDATSG